MWLVNFSFEHDSNGLCLLIHHRVFWSIALPFSHASDSWICEHLRTFYVSNVPFQFLRTVSSVVCTCSHRLPVFPIEDVFGNRDTCQLSENHWTVSLLKFSFKILINVYSVCGRLSAKNSLVPRACPPERRFERKSLVTRLGKVLLINQRRCETSKLDILNIWIYFCVYSMGQF